MLLVIAVILNAVLSPVVSAYNCTYCTSCSGASCSGCTVSPPRSSSLNSSSCAGIGSNPTDSFTCSSCDLSLCYLGNSSSTNQRLRYPGCTSCSTISCPIDAFYASLNSFGNAAVTGFWVIVGLAVGLGVGIPLLIILIVVLVICCTKKTRVGNMDVGSPAWRAANPFLAAQMDRSAATASQPPIHPAHPPTPGYPQAPRPGYPPQHQGYPPPQPGYPMQAPPPQMPPQPVATKEAVKDAKNVEEI